MSTETGGIVPPRRKGSERYSNTSCTLSQQDTLLIIAQSQTATLILCDYLASSRTAWFVEYDDHPTLTGSAQPRGVSICLVPQLHRDSMEAMLATKIPATQQPDFDRLGLAVGGAR